MPLLKRSVSLHGHRTSVALEPQFWAVLNDAASNRKKSLASLIAEIDDTRDPDDPLSSALRVWALEHVKAQSDQ